MTARPQPHRHNACLETIPRDTYQALSTPRCPPAPRPSKQHTAPTLEPRLRRRKRRIVSPMNAALVRAAFTALAGWSAWYLSAQSGEGVLRVEIVDHATRR